MGRYIALHLDAGRTTMGNPRRVYLIIDAEKDEIVDAVDEGYQGSGSLAKAWPHARVVQGGRFGSRIATTPIQYRELLKDAAKASPRRAGNVRRSSRRSRRSRR